MGCLWSWRCSEGLGPAPSCTMPKSKAQASVRRHPKQLACPNCSSTRLALHPARAAQGCLAYPGTCASSKLLSWEEGMFRKPRPILFPHFHTPKKLQKTLSETLSGTKYLEGRGYWGGGALRWPISYRQGLAGPKEAPKHAKYNARRVFGYMLQYHAASWARECSKPSAGLWKAVPKAVEMRSS